MFEGAKVSADSMLLPGVLPLLNGSAAAGFPVSESHEGSPQIREFDVHARINDGRRGVDARGDAKSLTLEARPYDAIESNHDDTARKARDEAGGHAEPDQLAKPTARTLGRATLRLRTTLRGRAALARSRFTLSRVGQRSPGGNPSCGRNRDRTRGWLPIRPLRPARSARPAATQRAHPRSRRDYSVGGIATLRRRAS